ncbi:MAG: Hsp20/alpha crystallin family protein [Acidobacteria bacterium]|jgi:HSP20 family protein|nr:Hsp20/alpha crystallin family protein [Acidobacteriota bacterium]
MAKQHRLLNELTEIERQLTQLLRSSGVYSVEQGANAWSPAVDIYETPTGFVLTAEVPGVKSPEIDIKVIDRTLILRGERRWERDAAGEHFHRLESSYGKFERNFSLSEGIDAEGISAELSDGILKVVLPKRTTPSKQIEIKTED